MQPTDVELEVLKVLWIRAPMSAREIHEDVSPRTGWAVSTTRTILERMRVKKLLVRESSHGLAVFRPAHSKVSVIGESLRHVFRGMLEVPGHLPVSAFSGSALLSENELAQLERIVNAKDPSP